MKLVSLRKKEFIAVYNKGKRVHSAAFSVYYLPGEEIKAGVVAGKFVGNAVQRNRGKRVLRAALKESLAALKISGWIVLKAKKELLLSGNAGVIAKELKAVLLKASQG